MNAIRPSLRFRILAALAAMMFSGPAAMARNGKATTGQDSAAAEALFTNGIILVLKIDIPNPGMKSLRRDRRTCVQATVRDGGTVYTNVMIRLKGGAGSFRPVDNKPGLTLKFEEASASFHGLNKIHLNNSVQDRTFLSEWLCGEIFREAGVPAPRAVPVLVELNGRRLGICVLLESVDRQFLARYFKNTHGNVYCPPGNSDITEPLDCIGGRERNNRADVEELAAAATTPGSARLPQVLDMDRFLSFLALEVMLCHRDGYTFNVKNYLIYHDLDSQKMVFIPHDLDTMLQDPNQPALPRVQGVVSKAVLADRLTQKRYLERLSDLYRKVFVAPVLIGRIDALVAKIGPAIQAYDPDLARAFMSHVGNLKTRIVSRARALRAQLNASELGLSDH